jgi:antitoxin component YwqK of YwqJK toxin-antitoxin module/Tfp pilus assembly protein PilF
MNRYVALFAVLSLGSLYSIAQENNPLINSAEAIKAGVKLYDEDKYKEAFKEYQKVRSGDTNYVWALYEMALTCAADSQFTRGIKICQEALSLTSERERCPDLLMQYGNLVDYAGQPERALQIYDSAMAIYPAHISLYVSKGTTLIRMKKYKEAEKVFKQGLLINPFSASCHFKLGLCALNQGNIIPAYLSLVANVMMEPEGRFSTNSISLLDNIAKGKDDIVELVNKRTEEPGENFRLIEQIVLSKIALDKNYKALLDLDDPISRQLQVICEKLSYDASDNDFWMQFYVPFYRKAFDDKKFEYLVNYAFSGVNIKAIKDFNRKNKKDIEAFVTQLVEYTKVIRTTRELQVDKRNTNGSCYYYQNGLLIGKGVSKNNGEVLTGPWEFYFPTGNKKATGTYNDKGEKEGEWKYYYFNGQVKGEEIYRGGKQEGKETYYYDHGAVSSRATYKNGEADGEHTAYYKDGVIKVIDHFANGKLNGLKKNFSTTGVLNSEVVYMNDLRNGTFKTYHDNGKVASEGSYVDDKLSGSYKAWYDDGVVSMTARYDQDKPTGEMKKFHENGKLKSVEYYNNGLMEGEFISYFDNGQLNTKYTSKKGKADGDIQYFDKDGKLFSTITFDNDKAKSARFFDKTGKQISISELSKGKLDMTTYRPDGTKKVFTPYNAKGEVNGKQTYYTGSGKEREVNNYVNSELNGESISYFANGQKSTTTPYVAGKKDGYYISWFIHGGKQEEGWYKDDELQGEWLTYNEQGVLTNRSRYLNGELNGLKTYYWPNGKLESESLYDMGTLLEMTEYDTTGKVLNVVKLKNGTGKFTSLYVNGKLASEGNYLNGNLEGFYKHFYFDGSTQTVQYFKKGLRDSIYKSYHYGGKISTEGTYNMGDKTGTWKYYREDGSVSRIEEYKAGKLHGKRTYYFKNGKTDTEVPYKNGDRDGLFKKYSVDGVLAYQLRYDDDVLSGYSYLGKNNEPVPEIPLVQGNGSVKSFFPNGNASLAVDYVDGSQHGSYKQYHPNGKLLLENTEYYGNSEGVLKEYNSDGSVRSVYNYLYDNTHGAYKEYNEKGILIEEGSSYNGNDHGEIRFYDDNGKLKQTRFFYYGYLLSVK